MFSWFSRAAVSPETADWLVECFSWAMQNFDVQHFSAHTSLVLPNNDFFPTKVDTPQGMAQYSFERVVALAGVKKWPWELVEAHNFAAEQPPILGLNPGVRTNEETSVMVPAGVSARLLMSYTPDQLSKPQDLIASMAHGVAQHVLWQSQLTPPGGQEYFLQTAEVLAIFMGFGVMTANSAYTFRGSCAKCYNPRANRQASLSESESVYALALFCELKGIPDKAFIKYLKKYLKSSLKSARHQIARHPNADYLRTLAA